MYRRIVVLPADVVYIKGIFEASDGVAALFAERGGDLLIAAPVSKAEELDELLRDLHNEIRGFTELPDDGLWTSRVHGTDTVAEPSKSF